MACSEDVGIVHIAHNTRQFDEDLESNLKGKLMPLYVHGNGSVETDAKRSVGLSGLLHLGMSEKNDCRELALLKEISDETPQEKWKQVHADEYETLIAETFRNSEFGKLHAMNQFMRDGGAEAPTTPSSASDAGGDGTLSDVNNLLASMATMMAQNMAVNLQIANSQNVVGGGGASALNGALSAANTQNLQPVPDLPVAETGSGSLIVSSRRIPPATIPGDVKAAPRARDKGDTPEAKSPPGMEVDT